MPTLIKPGFSRNYAKVISDPGGQSLQDIDPALIEDLYKKFGAILLRGYDLDADSFWTLTQSICTHAVLNESGGRKMVNEAHSIQTVNLGDRPFPLHPELSRAPWKPDICWFGCMIPPKSGGETTICDGTKIVRRMPKDIFKSFENRRLLYKRRAPPADLKYWLGTDDPTDKQIDNPPADCPFVFERNNDVILLSFTRPSLHKPMFTNQLCFGNFLLFSRYYNYRNSPLFEDGSMVPDDLLESVKKLGDRNLVAIRWQTNDVLILDNTRFMHGRRKIKDMNHRHILTYFGFLKFAVPSDEEGENPRWRNPKLWQNVQMG